MSIVKINLKQRIQDIIEKYKPQAGQLVGDAHIFTKRVMWECGLEVLKDYSELEDDKLHRGGRGVDAVCFRNVGRKLNRTGITIKRWIDLVKTVGKTEKDFQDYAIKERKRVIETWLQGIGPKEIEDKKDQKIIIQNDLTPIIIRDDILNGLKQIPDNSIDLFCIDPPYNLGKEDGIRESWDQYDNYDEWTYSWLSVIYNKLKNTGSLYLFGVFHILKDIANILDELSFIYKKYIIWDTIQGAAGGLWVNRHEDILFYVKSDNYFCDKEAVKVNRHEKNIRIYGGKEYKFKNLSNIWRIPLVDSQDKERTGHPTQKPVAIIDRMIKATCPSNGIVLDPFIGSGTTAIACIRNKIKCIGIEREKEYIKMANYRINKEMEINK